MDRRIGGKTGEEKKYPMDFIIRTSNRYITI